MRLHRFRLPALALVCLTPVLPALAASEVGPRLLALDGDGSDTEAFALPAEPILAPLTALRLRFDTEVTLGLADVVLIGAGADDRFDTTDCVATPGGDDLAQTIESIDGVPGHAPVLRLAGSTALRVGRYRLLLCDSIRDATGRALDGDDDGRAGGTARRDFSIAHSPRTENPGFAHDRERWSVRSLGAGAVTSDWVAQDADASDSSGALRIASAVGAPALLSSDTCVLVHEVGANAAAPATVRFRYRVVSGAVRLVVTASAGFAGDVGGGGCIGPGILRTHVWEAGAASESFGTYHSPGFDLQSLPRASLYVQILPLQGAYEIVLDDIGFNFAALRVFGTGFEAGR